MILSKKIIAKTSAVLHIKKIWLIKIAICVVVIFWTQHRPQLLGYNFPGMFDFYLTDHCPVNLLTQDEVSLKITVIMCSVLACGYCLMLYGEIGFFFIWPLFRPRQVDELVHWADDTLALMDKLHVVIWSCCLNRQWLLFSNITFIKCGPCFSRFKIKKAIMRIFFLFRLMDALFCCMWWISLWNH